MEKKILVVEDDSVLRYVLMEKLKNTGYIVSGAEDGEVAVKKIKDEKPDLVLLDILMPKKDGMEVLEDMNASEEMSGIPVIVISNSGQPVEMERAKALGAKDFLIKAIFDPNEVLEKVKKLLDGTDDSIEDDKEKNKMKDSSDNKTLSDNSSQSSTPAGISSETIKKEGAVTKGGNGKILVVEDDKFLRELLVRKLFNGGFEVESTIDATGTFEILSDWMPNIILLDLILPGEDGFSVLEKLKKDKKFASVPVIILSNLGQQEDVDRAMALGAIDFMVKANFTLDEIINKVSSALEAK